MNKWLKLLSYCVFLAVYLVLILTFLTAFYSGMRVLVLINVYGEAWFELILLSFFTPLIIINRWSNIKDVAREINEQEVVT